MAINGKSKGDVAEREVAALLKAWWGAVEPDVEFVRTPGSGGWQGANARGRQLRSEFRLSGDLATTSRQFPFSVESKRREEWTIARLVDGKPSPVWDWWCQCQRAAVESGEQLVPMLWMRHNRERWWVMLPAGFAMLIPGLAPEVTWTARQLLGVDAGALLPALFKASALLSVPAETALAAYGQWEPGATTTRVVVG